MSSSPEQYEETPSRTSTNPLQIMLSTRYPLDGVLTGNVTRALLSTFRPTCDYVEDGTRCDGASFNYKDTPVPMAQAWFHINADSHRLPHIRSFSRHRRYLQDRFVYYAITLRSLCPHHLKEAMVPGWSDGYTDIKTEPCGMVTGQRNHTASCQNSVRSDGEGGPMSMDGKRRCSEIHAMRSNIRQLWSSAYTKGTKRTAEEAKTSTGRTNKKRYPDSPVDPTMTSSSKSTTRHRSILLRQSDQPAFRRLHPLPRHISTLST